MLPPPNKSKKGKKPLEGLTGCKNIWKEAPAKKVKKVKKVKKPLEVIAGMRWPDASLYALKVKKGKKPLEGLAGCKNIWKEAPAKKVKKVKKVKKPLEGLAGCKNIWKEPPAHVAWAYNPALWEKENKVEA